MADEQQDAMTTVNLGLDIAKEHLARQLDTADKIDAKAGAILVAATAGLTFAIALRSKDFVFINAQVVLGLCALTLLAYCALVFCAARAYWSRGYHMAAGTDGLNVMVIEEQWAPHRFAEQIFANLTDAIKSNAKVLDEKATWLHWTLIFLSVQLGVIALIFLFETLH